MPINASERRLEVSEAAWRVIVREGLDHASMRAIAQELGTTIGVITHHFRNKDELMLFALDQVTQRLIRAMGEGAMSAKGLKRLEQMLFVLLPSNSTAEDILKVWIAFLGYAIGRESLMIEHQRQAGKLKQIIAQEIIVLQSAKLIREDIDPNVEAQALLALANGLAIDFIIQTQPLQFKQQQDVLKRYIRTVLARL